MPLPILSVLIRSRRGLVGLFFGLLALLGVALHRDYGMSWDEPADRLNAFVSAKYVALQLAPAVARRQPRLADIPDLHQHRDADHGVLFMLPLVVLEALRPGSDPAEWAYRRHLVGFLLFVAGAWAVYRLGREQLASWRWGLMGAGLLVLSPRIFAEAFYNYKDIIFLSLFALAMLTLTRLLRRPSAGRVVLHAAVTAAAIDVRTMGVLIPLLTLGFGALEMAYRPVRRRAFAKGLALYLPVLGALVVVGWPHLWENPFGHFMAALRSFSQYAKPMEVLYWGQYWPIQQLPWHYAPVWLLITTPVPYVVLAGLGIAALGLALVSQGTGAWLRQTTARRYLLVLAWFFGPLVGVVLLHSALYDGWRHLYFVYPAFVLLAALGLKSLVGTWQRWRQGREHKRGLAIGASLLLVLLGLGTVQAGWRLIADHPFQYAYFSFLPGKAIEQKFERDYWGLSTRQGLEWVLAHDPRPVLTVGMDDHTALTLVINSKMLAPAERARLRFAEPDKAEYYFSIHRWHAGPYPDAMGRPIHTIRVGGAVILTVLRRP